MISKQKMKAETIASSKITQQWAKSFCNIISYF